MININLLREPTAKKRRLGLKGAGLAGPSIFVLVVAALALTGLLAWYFMLSGELEEKQARVDSLRRQNLQLKQITAQIAAARQEKDQIEQKVALIESLRNSQRGPVRLMNQLLDAIPNDPKLWLTNLMQRGGGVTLEGRAFDVPTIADFIAKLGRQPLFRNVELEFWEEQADSIKFQLNCQVDN